MRVSQRVDYALRALTVLVRRGQARPIAAGRLADALGLPRRFVEQQFTALSRAGILECARGAGGGCRLVVPPADITVADVLRAIEGDVLDVPRTTDSAVAEMWAETVTSLTEVLEGTTLEQLARRQAAIDSQVEVVYHI